MKISMTVWTALTIGGLAVSIAGAQTRGTSQETGTDISRDARRWLDEFDRRYGASGNDYPSAQVDKVPGAMAGAAVARAEQRQSYSELNRVIRWKIEDFENHPEVRAANRELDAAYEHYLAARDRAMARLADDPTYLAAVSLRDRISQDLSELHALKQKNDNSILAAASVKLTHASVARDLESAALSNDADVSAARQRLTEANAKIVTLRAEFRRELQRSDQVAQARDQFDNARIARLGAEAYLDGAIDAARSAVDYSYNLHRYDRYRYSSYGRWCDDGYRGVYSVRY